MELRDLLEGTYRVERRVRSIASSLRFLKADLTARDRYGYEIVFAIDYAEVFRYLHPELDRNRHVDPEVFYTEQVALRHIFERMKETVLFLPAYSDEFRRHLDSVRQEATRAYERVAGLPAEADHRETVKRAYPGIRRVMEDFEKTMDAEDETVRESAREAIRYFLDLLLETKRRQHLSDGMSKFKGLLVEKRIVPLDRFEGIEETPVIDESSSQYLDLLGRIKKERPGQSISNSFDAKAVFTLDRLNESKWLKKKFFVLVSSSRTMWRAFRDITTELAFDKKTETVPILRDLYYFLMRYYYAGFGFPSAIDQIDKTQLQIRQYSNKIGMFRSYVYDKRRASEEVDDEFVEEVSAVYNNMVDQIKFFETLRPTAEDEALLKEVGQLIPDMLIDTEESRKLLEAIRAILDDPPRLREELRKMLEAVNKATQQLDDWLKKLPVSN